MTPQPRPLQVGDRVRWTSQGAGIAREKVGEVVAVVRARMFLEHLDSWVRLRDSHTMSDVFPWHRREHQSYLVSVASSPGSHAKPRLYWPRVSALELLTPAPETQA